ncbi:TD and POZ domain-containing protein 3 [Nephila pilipes]|uniref:TD and POZ domain-containing protein 3 n=1 Tax=Nephila pilipes TaxID=299642 RepID=A0A8X6QJ46_NEPPI|nr:TD and POZ domain-containing protein 3 [Nephila pilipes]
MACCIAIESEPWVTFLWNIENFSYCWQNGNERLSSPEFIVESPENSKWQLMLYPKGREDKNFICYDLHSRLLNDTRDLKYNWSFEVECEIAILAENGSVLKIKGRERTELNYKKVLLEFKNFADLEDVLMAKREAFLSGDTLRTRCRLWKNHEKPTTIFARTVLNVQKRNFIWDIVRFTSLAFDRKYYYFITEGDDKLADIDIEIKEIGSIGITMKNLDHEVRYVIFRPLITDKNGSRIDCGKYEMNHSTSYDYVTHSLPLTIHKLMENKDMYLKNDILSLYCEFSWTNGSVDHRFEKNYSGITSPSISNPVTVDPCIISHIGNPIIPKLCTTSSCISNETILKPCISNPDIEQMDEMVDLKEDMEYLYTEGILSDVKLRTISQTFHAHKNILSARSPVFRKMFETDMKEKIQECVEVPDLEDDTVRRMLLYVYTNTLEGLEWESALNLYVAADKYEMAALKSKCSSFLKRNLCPDNLGDALALADSHVDCDLKEAVQDYALEHEEDVFRSEVWKVFAKNNSSLAMELMLWKWNKK